MRMKEEAGRSGADSGLQASFYIRHFSLAGLLACSLLAAQGEPVRRGWVISEHTVIYATPDLFAPPIGHAALGDTCPVVGDSAGWVEVRLIGGGRGWIPARRMQIPSSASGCNCCCTPGTSGGQIAGAVVGASIGIGVTALLASVSLENALAGFTSAFVEVHGSRGMTATTFAVAGWSALVADLLTPGIAAFGTCLAGEREYPGGGFWSAAGCAAIGDLIGTGIGYGADALLSSSGGGGTYPVITIAAAIVGTSLGAVAGYDLSRPKGAQAVTLGDRLLPPVLALGVPGPGKCAGWSARAELIRVRF